MSIPNLSERTTDADLRWVSQTLSAAGIRFWLDSGTLLGIVRDGRLLPGDPDIDLSIWEDELPTLLGLAGKFESGGYRCRVEALGGVVFNLTLIPRLGSGRRRIDVCAYRRSNGRAWAPALLPRTRMRKARSGLPWLRTPWDLFLHALWARGVRRLDIDQWPWRTFFRLKTWWIPAEYFERIERGHPSWLPIPREPGDYLSFRYGAWEVPAEKWSYWDDDRGLAPRTPREMVIEASSS